MIRKKRWGGGLSLRLAIIIVLITGGLPAGCERRAPAAYTSETVYDGQAVSIKPEASPEDTLKDTSEDAREGVLQQELFERETRTVPLFPLVSCLYFDEDSFKEAIASAVVFKEDITGLNGGIVPHHLLAGRMIASFWKTVSRGEYDLIVIIGPDHWKRGKTDLTTLSSGFASVYGDVAADTKLVNLLIRENLVSEDPDVMEIDHAISSHIPFISYYMPDTPVLPLLVKGNCSPEKIFTLSDEILSATQDRRVLFVASIDFSHYLSLEEANQKDEYTEKVLADFDYDRIMEMTNDHLDSRPSALFLLHTLSCLESKTMEKWAHSNSDSISRTVTGYTTSYFVFGFYEEGIKVPAGSGQKTNLMAAGDIMLGRGVSENLKLRSLSFIYPFIEVKSILDQGDIVFGNLEHPLTDSRKSLDGEFKYILKGPMEAVFGLDFAGFDVVSLANNHMMDYYETGLTDTIRLLDDHDIAYAGAGQNLKTAREPAILERNGIRIGFLAYTDMAEVMHPGNPPLKFEAEPGEAGVAPLKADWIREDISKVRDNVDIIVVSLHWGIEDSYQVTDEQIRLAHDICDMGADVILGHHPHRFQGIEIYRGKPIAYSLGNFIFDQVPENQESFILNLTFENARLTGMKAIPVRTVDLTQVVPQKPQEAAGMLERQLQLSHDLGTECIVSEGMLVYK